MGDLFKVIITHNGDEKYIIASVQDQVSKASHWLLVSMPLKYHSLIVRHVEDGLNSNERMQVYGGGLLRIDRKNKKIFTYGMSGGYGAPDATMVKEILSNSTEFKEYQLEITVTDYIRD